jgi:hypothetical protein
MGEPDAESDSVLPAQVGTDSIVARAPREFGGPTPSLGPLVLRIRAEGSGCSGGRPPPQAGRAASLAGFRRFRTVAARTAYSTRQCFGAAEVGIENEALKLDVSLAVDGDRLDPGGDPAVTEGHRGRSGRGPASRARDAALYESERCDLGLPGRGRTPVDRGPCTSGRGGSTCLRYSAGAGIGRILDTFQPSAVFTRIWFIRKRVGSADCPAGAMVNKMGT